MTTNSPNPVDGDVQAHTMPALTQAERKTAIDSCVAEIAHLERCIKAHPDQPVLKVDLLVQQVALATLTAETKTCDACIDVLSALGFNYKSAKLKSVLAKVTELQESKPAQTLRQVELPMVKTARSNWSTWNWIEHLGGRFQNGNPGDYIEFGSVYAVAQMLKQYRRTVTAEVIVEIKESLRQQGYEVKND